MEKEKNIFEVGQSFDTNGGTTLLCYGVTDMFAFMAPVEEVEGKIFLEVEKTVVYQREITEEVVSPIKNIELGGEEKAE